MSNENKKRFVVSSILSDILIYFFNKPSIKTLIDYKSLTERKEYQERILHRLGVSVEEYSILNIHKIGINLPAKYVFEELLHWDGDSYYWPNQLARVKRFNGNLENIIIYLFGIERIHLKYLTTKEIRIKPLFNMSALKFQHITPYTDADNARYLLYQCHGGYPIGIFALYVRSSIAVQNELENTQLFSVVAFNFYGRNNWFYNKIINPIWERMHNRVTANILNRMKLEFENKFHE